MTEESSEVLGSSNMQVFEIYTPLHLPPKGCLVYLLVRWRALYLHREPQREGGSVKRGSSKQLKESALAGIRP